MNIPRACQNIYRKYTFTNKSTYNFCTNLQISVVRAYSRTRIMSDVLRPPETVKGMTVLDKNMFNKQIEIRVVVSENVKVSSIIPHLKKYLLKLDNFKPVVTSEKESGVEVCMYLNPEKVLKWLDIDEADRSSLKALGLTEDNFLTKLVTLTYENFPAMEIFKAVLPSDQEGFSSFTAVGHIVHVNLREHLIPYKELIGPVLLEKSPHCKTVVNKVNMIDNTYRNFKMEVLAGEDVMLTKVKENRCQFEFDFSTVYWNSRLSSEHERIVNILKQGDVLFDVFAGVGPFAVPVAKKKCVVYANDLNPESYKWLNHNLKLNKVDAKLLRTYNKDGKDFILTDLKENLLKHLHNNVHITMNLPALAVEFISCFSNLYSKTELPDLPKPPTVYLYCFSKGEDYVEIAKQLVFKNIGWDISDKIIDIFRVRTVSSFKEMVRVSIRLDYEILVGRNETGSKRKVDDFESLELACKKS